jgi:hypothetical protein
VEAVLKEEERLFSLLKCNAVHISQFKGCYLSEGTAGSRRAEWEWNDQDGKGVAAPDPTFLRMPVRRRCMDACVKSGFTSFALGEYRIGFTSFALGEYRIGFTSFALGEYRIGFSSFALGEYRIGFTSFALSEYRIGCECSQCSSQCSTR